MEIISKASPWGSQRKRNPHPKWREKLSIIRLHFQEGCEKMNKRITHYVVCLGGKWNEVSSDGFSLSAPTPEVICWRWALEGGGRKGNTFLNFLIILDLQCSVGFFCTAKWPSYTFIYMVFFFFFTLSSIMFRKIFEMAIMENDIDD